MTMATTEIDGENYYVISGIKGSGAVEAAEPLSPIPELPSIVLLGIGLAILIGYFWLRRRKIVKSSI
jgi:LPXTG-motif cell wall-anchored protein